MYTPGFFVENDKAKLIAFMREYSFAALVTSSNGVPEASHLPFIIEELADKIVLSAHMALANEQWKHFGKSDVLVIFAEPHAYISPTHYEQVENVPTWNYVAVHAYGKATLFESVEDNLALLEKLTAAFDKDYYEGNWQLIPEEYKIRHARGIKAFAIEVTDLQGKKKLSQNKPGKDAQNVIAAFESSTHENERRIAEYMKAAHGLDTQT